MLEVARGMLAASPIYSRLFAIAAAKCGRDALGIPDPLNQHVDAVAAPEQLVVEYHRGNTEHAECFRLIDNTVMLGTRLTMGISFEIRGRSAERGNHARYRREFVD